MYTHKREVFMRNVLRNWASLPFASLQGWGPEF